MSRLRRAMIMLLTSGGLGACAITKVPELPILDSPAVAARHEPDPQVPVRYVEVPTPLPLPGQLKPVGKGDDKKKNTRSPSERVTVGGKRDVEIMEVLQVGNYAVRLVFDDMHSTGIYHWYYLYGLGRDYAATWQAYLDELAAKGMTREPAMRH